LVGVDFGQGGWFDPELEELALLASSAGDEPVARVTARRKAPDAALFVGSGKAEEIKADKSLWQMVQKHASKRVKSIRSVSDLRAKAAEMEITPERTKGA
jgi:GTP-binding protein HflX